ncbi:MAG: radical SAM protein [Candidatus Omnitrophica bacterium]|nr:radical SAM protein [Candidatus Omnitrophota bacterium]
MFPESFEKIIENNNIPISVSFELTYKCNQKCLFCYQPSPHSSDGEMGTEKVKDVLRELALEGTLFLSLTGGEPLSRPDFWEIARYARSLKFALTLQTNGTLIDRRTAEKLRALGFFQAHISLLGQSAATHDALTGMDGAFVRATGAIKLLKRAGLTVLTKTTVVKGNAAELGKIQELAEELGAAPIFSHTVFPGGGFCKTPIEHRISDDDMRGVVRFLSSDGGGPDEFNIERDTDGPVCFAGRTEACVTPTGLVQPCVGFFMPIGDLNKNTFREIWTGSGRLNEFRALKVRSYGGCGECGLLSLCEVCPGMGFMENGSLLGPSPENCRATRILKEVIHG